MNHAFGLWLATLLLALVTDGCSSSTGTTRKGERADGGKVVVTLAAAEALAGSPGPGACVEIERSGANPLPHGSCPFPAVLSVHEIFGVIDWMRVVADRLAEVGYVAVVPDFISGFGPDAGATHSVASRDEVARLIRRIEPHEALPRLAVVGDYASTGPDATGELAVV